MEYDFDILMQDRYIQLDFYHITRLHTHFQHNLLRYIVGCIFLKVFRIDYISSIYYIDL
jgi:hypothetical protein